MFQNQTRYPIAMSRLRSIEQLFDSVKSGVNVVFIGEKKMRTLNRTYRGKDAVTDILSFTYNEPGLLGEIFICPTYRKHTFGHLLVHGILHLQGHDHEDAKSAEKMEALEQKLLSRLS